MLPSVEITTPAPTIDTATSKVRDDEPSLVSVGRRVTARFVPAAGGPAVPMLTPE